MPRSPVTPWGARQRLTHTAWFPLPGKHSRQARPEASGLLHTQPAGEVTPPFPPRHLTHSHLPLCCAQQSSTFDTRRIAVTRNFVAWGRLERSFWRAFWQYLPQTSIPFDSAILPLRIYPHKCVDVCVYVCVCMCVSMCVCVCVYIHKDVHAVLFGTAKNKEC